MTPKSKMYTQSFSSILSPHLKYCSRCNNIKRMSTIQVINNAKYTEDEGKLKTTIRVNDARDEQSIEDTQALHCANLADIITCILRSEEGLVRESTIRSLDEIIVSMRMKKMSRSAAINLLVLLAINTFSELGYDTSEYKIESMIRIRAVSTYPILMLCAHRRSLDFFDEDDDCNKQHSMRCRLVEFFSRLTCYVRMGLGEEADFMFKEFMKSDYSHYTRYYPNSCKTNITMKHITPIGCAQQIMVMCWVFLERYYEQLKESRKDEKGNKKDEKGNKNNTQQPV